MHEIWIEKHRPTSLDDVVGNTETVARLRCVAARGNMPHLMLAGPPGTGKTTCVDCLANQLLGIRSKTAVLELNASDERGIDTVRDKIKGFAKELMDLPENRHKLVVLDECDSMTEAAQHALRRLMELYSETTRFVLICNQSTKVIEPIQSRCAILRFSRITDESILERLLYICKVEQVKYINSGLDALLFSAEGDMRNAINNLQSTVNGFGEVNRENVVKVCDMPPPERVRAILDCCKKSNWQEAHTKADELIKDGYSPADICGVIRGVLRKYSLPEHVFLEYLKETSRMHFVFSEGCQSLLQLDKLLCNFCKISMMNPSPN